MENHIRIVVLDYYMSPPIPGLDILYSDFRGTSVSQVPVLRCFGSNGHGQKICVHIHGVFPYLYIPFDGNEDADSFSYQLATSIDNAVNISLNQGSSSTQHVYKISRVSGIPMYGYHFKKHQFFKIYLYNPMVVPTVSKLLSNQSILGKIFQPHEAHINFTLQFMIDHNLHGMSNMIVDDIKYRTNSCISTNNYNFLPSNIEKITTCELEADINAQNIINGREIVSGKLVANPGIAALWEDEKQRLRNKNENSQLGHFIELKNINVSPTKSHLVYKEALSKRLILLSSDERDKNFEENMSVYPAETPDDVDIQNASIVDLHTPSSLELSLDDSLMELSQNVTLSESYINVSLDDADLSFANVLKELENVNSECVEEGSILSQTVVEDAEGNSEYIEDLDLSMPLIDVVIPEQSDIFQNSDESMDNILPDLNYTVIPQIDGQADIDCIRYKTRFQMKRLKENVGSVRPGRSMPSLDVSNGRSQTLLPKREGVQKELSINMNNQSASKINVKNNKLITETPPNKIKLTKFSNNHTKIKKNLMRQRFKRKGEETLEEQIRLLDFRINKLNVKVKLKRIKRAVRRKEKIWSLLLQQIPIPKFNLIPGQKWFLVKHKEETVVSHILEQTRNHIDHELHLIVEYQDNRNFLYYYGGKIVPQVVEISTNYTEEIKTFKSEQNKYSKDKKYLEDSIPNLINADDVMTSDIKSSLATTLELEKQLREAEMELHKHLRFLKNISISIHKSGADIDNFRSPPVSPEPTRLILDTREEANSLCNNSNPSTCDKVTNFFDFDKDSDNKVGGFTKYSNLDKPGIKNKRTKNEKGVCFPKRDFSIKDKLKSRSLLYINCDGTANTSSSEDETDIEDHKWRTGSATAGNGLSETFSNNPTKTTNSQSSQTWNQSLNSSDSDIYSDEAMGESFLNAHRSKAVSGQQCTEADHVTKQIYSNVFSPNLRFTNLSNSNLNFTENSQTCNYVILTPKLRAPTKDYIEKSLDQYQLPEIIYPGPFYSKVQDCTGSVEIGQNVLNIPSKTTAHLKEFDSHNDALNKFRKFIVENIVKLNWNQNNLKKLKLTHCGNGHIIITPLKKPPSVSSVNKWVEENSKPKYESKKPKIKLKKSSFYVPSSYENDMESISISPCTQSEPQSGSDLFLSSEESTPSLRKSVICPQDRDRSGVIEGVTQSSYTLQKSVENLQAVRSVVQYQYLTTLVIELQVRTREKLNPDPEFDPICGIFYSFINDAPRDSLKILRKRGVFVIKSLPNDTHNVAACLLNGSSGDYDITYADSEETLLQNFLNFMILLDPDILAGYEVHMLSWGYLIDRAKFINMDIIQCLGRSQINKFYRFKRSNDHYDLETAITGRIVLDIWRLMRHEVALQSYSFESIVYAILRRRVPRYSFQTLTQWWDHPTNLHRHKVVEYYFVRVDSVLDLFEKQDFINRTSELARLFGIMFYEVLSRGSQFRVESMMLRLAKPLNYIPVSPSVVQRARMKAPEYIPLVMEPESKMYNDPVIVLDFQSLYPSIIIAYNYCFTTCMGRVECLGKNGTFEFGATQLKISKRVTEKLAKRDLINFSPCGVAFVKKELREGILPRMLKEILDTRLMVKNAMKENAENNVLQKVLHNRQLGLKLIANVTYGYTAANFSGRMCCVEVGDSVVSKGRETLQRAIAMVDSTPEWGAKVVYGDTDSLFVLVPGKCRKGAFEVGKKIADAITNDNPDPIKLKLEKVYHPCILQTKKRYVGYMYESPDQKEPVYDAKGIETVRRDGCPAVSKMLEKCLRLLFETKDVSLIKHYVLRQLNKIQSGKTSIQDLTFAKEYRGSAGYKPGACVPALELARKWKLVDRRSEPRSGERVPYVIVNGPPGLPLIRLVRSPWDILNDCSLKPNTLYYITKVIIPPINRCLSLIGIDVNTWFNQMPRKQAFYLPNSSSRTKTTLSQYFVNKICAVCESPTMEALCQKCCQKPDVAAITLFEKLRIWEKNHYETNLICHSCTRSLVQVACISLDCPVLYRRIQSHRELHQSNYLRNLLSNKDIF